MGRTGTAQGAALGKGFARPLSSPNGARSPSHTRPPVEQTGKADDSASAPRWGLVGKLLFPGRCPGLFQRAPVGAVRESVRCQARRSLKQG